MFFQILESNMKTVEEFTQKQVAQIRDALQSADQVNGHTSSHIITRSREVYRHHLDEY